MATVGTSWAGAARLPSRLASTNLPVVQWRLEAWTLQGGREEGPKRQHVHRSKGPLFPVRWSPGRRGRIGAVPPAAVPLPIPRGVWSTGIAVFCFTGLFISSSPHVPFCSVADGTPRLWWYCCELIILCTYTDSTLLPLLYLMAV